MRRALGGRVRRAASLGLGLMVVGLAPRASGFEREWHFGGGVGASAAPAYALGPALNAYAAYGISDAFDARAELSTSFNQRADSTQSFYSLKLALAYKIDVGKWIPWVAGSGGVLRTGTGRWPFETMQPTAGVIGGLDYAWTRHFGVGLCLTGDYGFQEAAVYGAGFIRAEYHFGW